MKKIVITGANGFLGSTITKRLLNEGYEVISLVRNGSDTSLLPENSNIKFVDYNSSSDLIRIFSDADVIIHNAGLTKAKNWKAYKEVNVDLTKRIVDLFNINPTIEHLIFLSSQAAAGPSLDNTPLDEDLRCHPVSLYGKSKLMAENLIRTKVEKKWTIIRPASIFGPGDKDFLQLFKMIKKHIMLYPIQKEKIFSMIYSDDVAELINLVIIKPETVGQIFFAANNESYKQVEIIGYIESIMDSFVNHFVIPEFLLKIISGIFELFSRITGKINVINMERMKEFRLDNWQISNKKSKDLLGFAPKYEIYEALHKTYQWYLEKGWLKL